MTVPVFAIEPMHAQVDLAAAIDRVMASGRFVLGPAVEAFENDFASYCGTGRCIGVASGTDALELALRAVGMGPGDRVAQVANAGPYASTATRAAGAVPLYVDVEMDSLTMSPRHPGHRPALRQRPRRPPGTCSWMRRCLRDHRLLQLLPDQEPWCGVREGRDDPASSRLPGQLFWTLYRRLVVPEMPPGGVDVFACTRAFREQLLRLDERHCSLVAQLFWIGFRRAYVPYRRQARVHGRSAWTLRKRLGYLSDSLFSFTDLPIKLLIWLGGIVALLSGIYGAFIVVMRLLGQIEAPGFTITLLAIVFFGSLNLFALGVVGSYAWRAYENTKSRPLHIVQSHLVFKGRDRAP